MHYIVVRPQKVRRCISCRPIVMWMTNRRLCNKLSLKPIGSIICRSVCLYIHFHALQRNEVKLHPCDRYVDQCYGLVVQLIHNTNLQQIA